MFDSMMRQGGAPTLMAGLGQQAVLIYTPPDGSAAVTYDAIVGPLSRGEESENFGAGLAQVSGKNAVERRTVKVVPKHSAMEIVDTGVCKLDGIDWPIERIANATPSMITIELRRVSTREAPRARQQR